MAEDLKFLRTDFMTTSMQLLNMLLTLNLYIPKQKGISKKHIHYTQATFLHHKKKNHHKLTVIFPVRKRRPCENLMSDRNIQNGIRKISKIEKTSMPPITSYFTHISAEISPSLPPSNSQNPSC